MILETSKNVASKDPWSPTWNCGIEAKKYVTSDKKHGICFEMQIVLSGLFFFLFSLSIMNSLRLSCLAKVNRESSTLGCYEYLHLLQIFTHYRVFWCNGIVNRLSHSDERLEMTTLLRIWNF